MSRIGKKPIAVPAGVSVTIADGRVTVKGPKGELSEPVKNGIAVAWDAAARTVRVERSDDSRQARAMHGLQRALVANMVVGVTAGYSRGLEVHGTGYTADIKGKELVIQVGFADPVTLPIPAGIAVEIVQRAAQPNNPAKFTVRGIDKHLLGQFAANVRRARPPEPYNGKGIRYEGEYVRRKEGKAAVGAGH